MHPRLQRRVMQNGPADQTHVTMTTCFWVSREGNSFWPSVTLWPMSSNAEKMTDKRPVCAKGADPCVAETAKPDDWMPFWREENIQVSPCGPEGGVCWPLYTPDGLGLGGQGGVALLVSQLNNNFS